MLLRALCVAAVDSANRTRARAGRIVVVQSTADGAPRARALNAQDGLFTLVERGLSGGVPLERIGKIGAISRALAADSQWDLVCDVAAYPEIQVIVSHVAAAGCVPRSCSASRPRGRPPPRGGCPGLPQVRRGGEAALPGSGSLGRQPALSLRPRCAIWGSPPLSCGGTRRARSQTRCSSG